jgi:CRP-like cAMP-binding protein
MALREDLARVDLFRALPPAAFDELMQHGVTLKLRPGNTVVQEGSSDAGFQLIRRGTAQVLVHGVPRRELGPGDYFGEMSLVGAGPRSATIIAGPEGVDTFALSSLNFSTLMDGHPDVPRALLPVLIARIRELDSRQQPAE